MQKHLKVARENKKCPTAWPAATSQNLTQLYQETRDECMEHARWRRVHFKFYYGRTLKFSLMKNILYTLLQCTFSAVAKYDAYILKFTMESFNIQYSSPSNISYWKWHKFYHGFYQKTWHFTVLYSMLGSKNCK